MTPAFLWAVLTHQGEGADPRLLDWIKHTLDKLLGLGPWTVVVLFGLVLVAIPLAVMATYLIQRRRISPGFDDAPGDPAG